MVERVNIIADDFLLIFLMMSMVQIFLVNPSRVLREKQEKQQRGYQIIDVACHLDGHYLLILFVVEL